MSCHRIRAAAFVAVVLLGAGASAAQPPSLEERESKAQRYFGDTLLTTQNGKKVRLYSDVMKGKVVLVNFIYTNCKDACPLITAKLKQVKEELKEAFGPDVRFVSISTDPARDTPKVLAAFARKMEAEHDEWLFLTGRRADLDAVLKRFGAFSEDVEAHSTGILIGSTAIGRWKKVRPDAPPQAMTLELRNLVDLRKNAAKPAGVAVSVR